MTTSSTDSSQQKRIKSQKPSSHQHLHSPFTEENPASLRGWIFFVMILWSVLYEWPIQNRINLKMEYKSKEKASADYRVSASVMQMG